MPRQLEYDPSPKPLLPRVRYMRTGRGFIEDSGGVTHAVAELFDRANITVKVEGDASWLERGRGALLVGDHRSLLEALPLAALCWRPITTRRYAYYRQASRSIVAYYGVAYSWS